MKSEPGELRLEDGLITFTSKDRGLVFRAPLEKVRASFPKLYFGIGAKLAVHGKTYRLSFAPVQYHGWTASSDLKGGTSYGPTWSIAREDVGPARAAVQQWRTALEQPMNGSH